MSDKADITFSARLEHLKLLYEEGQKDALLEAIGFCGAFKIIMPEWVVVNFVNSFRKWKYLEIKDLDDAFEVRRKKYFRIDKERKLMNKSWSVFMDVVNSESIDVKQMEEIAKTHGLNRDECWDMYNYVRKNNYVGNAIYKMKKGK